MFKIYITESLKNINKNKISSILIMLLFIFLFIMLGFISLDIKKNDFFSEIYKADSFKSFDLYSFRTLISRRERGELYEDRIEHAKKVQEFFQKLNKIEDLKYVSIYDTGTNIKNFKGPETCLLGYESGHFDVNSNSVKMLITSDNFFKNESYSLAEGRNFNDDDIVYNPEGYTPVMLGYSYFDFYKPGDILEIDTDSIAEDNLIGSGLYHTKLIVIGIFAENTSVINGNGTVMINLNRYILMPFQYRPITELEVENTAWVINASYTYDMLFMWTKIMLDESATDTIIPKIQQVLNEFGAFSKYYTINNCKLMTDYFKDITQTTIIFYTTIFVVLCLFTLISLIITISNKIRNNLKDHTIHMLIGATSYDILLFNLFENTILLLLSDIFALVALLYLSKSVSDNLVNSVSVSLMCFLNLIIFILTILTSRLFIKKKSIQV